MTFQDWQGILQGSLVKAALAKIRGACAQALKDGLEYIWIDTNCIDKTSSAELSETINSMFAWYRDARVCYVYLVDVPRSVPVKTADGTPQTPFCAAGGSHGAGRCRNSWHQILSSSSQRTGNVSGPRRN